MARADGGSRRYATDLAALVVFGLHSLVPVASLFGVVNDACIGADLGLAPATTTLGASLIFVAWPAGALAGGALADARGRKPVVLASAGVAAFAFALLAAASEGKGHGPCPST